MCGSSGDAIEKKIDPHRQILLHGQQYRLYRLEEVSTIYYYSDTRILLALSVSPSQTFSYSQRLFSIKRNVCIMCPMKRKLSLFDAT